MIHLLLIQKITFNLIIYSMNCYMSTCNGHPNLTTTSFAQTHFATITIIHVHWLKIHNLIVVIISARCREFIIYRLREQYLSLSTSTDGEPTLMPFLYRCTFFCCLFFSLPNFLLAHTSLRPICRIDRQRSRQPKSRFVVTCNHYVFISACLSTVAIPMFHCIGISYIVVVGKMFSL